MNTQETRILIGTRIFSTEEENFTIEYYRTEKKKDSETVYGVCLKKSAEAECGREAGDSYCLPLTEDFSHICKIIDRLIGGAVTTTGLTETIDFIYDETF